MRRAAAVLLCAAAGCAAPPASSPGMPGAVEERVATPGVAGGSLRMDQVTVELRDGPVVLRVTPLDEEVLRLLAPDAARGLRRVREAHRQEGAAGAGSLLLVSFQSAEGERGFDPGAVEVEAGGRRLRPARIRAVTPGWGEQRLRPATAEAAVYLFDEAIDPFRPITLRYGALTSDRWTGVIPALEAERRRMGSE